MATTEPTLKTWPDLVVNKRLKLGFFRIPYTVTITSRRWSDLRTLLIQLGLHQTQADTAVDGVYAWMKTTLEHL